MFVQNPYYTDSITLAYLSPSNDLAKFVLMNLLKSKSRNGLIQIERTVFMKHPFRQPQEQERGNANEQQSYQG